MSYVTHERRSENPLWIRSNQKFLRPDSHFKIRFGLKQRNLEKLSSELHRVASPDSTEYAEHWTNEQIMTFFQPAPESQIKVQEWLKDVLEEGADIQLSAGGAWIDVDLTVSQANQLLKTEYGIYDHPDGNVHIACEEYSVPEYISDHLDLVIPSVHFDMRSNKGKIEQASNQKRNNKRRSTIFKREIHSIDVAQGSPLIRKPVPKPQIINSESSDPFSTCDQTTTLDCLNFPGLILKHEQLILTTNNLVEYSPRAVIFDDLDIFFKGSFQIVIIPTLCKLDQTAQSYENNLESNLDLSYAMSMLLIYEFIQVQLYQVGDGIAGSGFNNFLDALDATYCHEKLDPSQDGVYPGYNKRDCGTVKATHVISSSYSMSEAEATPNYLRRQCEEYGKLALMGVTFLHSSGDYGVAGFRGNCLTEDNRASPQGKRFNPTFPGTCPFVTIIGATQIKPGNSVRDPEESLSTYFVSGGGFSNLFEIPEYQKKTLKTYWDLHRPEYSSSQFNNSMKTRGYPDLSANGANYAVSIDGQLELVYGTSAAVPVVASMITLINDARISMGKSPVGFLNPALYSDGFRDAFNDITSGSNPGCTTRGFSAVKGWDPLTGLGTINFPKLLNLFSNLQ
ncbi:putative aorsin endoprotease precursor [Melampsora larici-populina 98AG31]|uniref:tripeptidyl-peptidase II n=1 Tax=Melampsora larici-populina (strain 98AG31 / pathotype 3-4-7) TaxID=747676 RepID=F4R7B9_MELLP|nr:putative aorsin endoprotease precursor [Melampsora larici-populina 98AG31]EGG11812.1 putative aorsin endoprotease precursor [Melampsora larici-populina 98AG31]